MVSYFYINLTKVSLKDDEGGVIRLNSLVKQGLKAINLRISNKLLDNEHERSRWFQHTIDDRVSLNGWDKWAEGQTHFQQDAEVLLKRYES